MIIGNFNTAPMPRPRFDRYAFAVAITALAILGTLTFERPVYTPFILFFGAVACASWYGGLLPGLLTSLISSAAYLYYFSEPYFSWQKNDPMAVLLSAATFIVISTLINLLITIFQSAKRDMAAVLSDNQEQIKAQMESIPHIVWTADPGGAVDYYNQYWYRYTGRSPGQSVGYGWEDVLHPDDVARTYDSMEQALIKGEEYSVEYRLRQGQTGEYRWFLGRAIPAKNAEGKIIKWYGTCTDIHAQKQELHLQEFMSTATKELGSSLNYEETIQNLARSVVPELADWCAVDIITGPNTLKRLAVAHIDPEKVTLAKDLEKRFPSDPNAQLGAWHTIKTGKSQLAESVLPEIFEQILNPEYRKIILSLNIKSYIIAPLQVGGKTIGAISFVWSESGRHYNERDLRLVEDLGLRAGTAIEHARTYSEMQRVEAELRRANSQMEAVFQNVADGISVQDRSGRVVYANVAAAKASGFNSPEDFLAASPQELLAKIEMMDETGQPLSSIDKLPGRRLLAGKNAEPMVIRYRIKGRPGEFWSMVKSAPVRNAEGDLEYVVNVFADISQIKKAEEAQFRMAAIVQSSQDAVISEALDGTIISWNKGATDLYGYTPEEAIGHHFSLLMPDGEDLDRHKGESFADGKPKIHADTIRRHKSGALIEVSMAVSPVYDAAGRLIGAATISRDITVRKQIERQKDDFISIASHELKTPLTSMKVFAQSLLRGAQRREGGQVEIQQLEVINRQIDKLVSLIRNILDVSRLDHGQLEMQYRSVGINEFLRDILKRMQPLAAGHKLILEAPENLTVRMDVDRVEQVVINFLNNAIFYTPVGTTILVRAESGPDEIIISVADEGPGIPAAMQKNIFERFFQAERQNSKGMGLGLYIARQIVEHHGGRIWVESVEGGGSTFFFSLPIGTISKT